MTDPVRFGSEPSHGVLAGFHELARVLAINAPIEHVLSNAVPIVRDLTRADRAAAFLGPPIRPVALLGISGEYIAQALANYRAGPAAAAESSGKVAFIGDVLDPNAEVGWIREAARKEGFRGLVLAPLIFGGRVVGAFSLYYDGPQAFDAEARAVVETIAPQLALAAENAQRGINVGRERDACDEILEELPVGVLLVGPSGQVERANRVSRRILSARQVARALGTHVADGVDREGKLFDPTLSPISRGFSGHRVEQTEVSLEAAPGELRTYLVDARPIGSRSLTVLQDITLARELEVYKDAVIQVASHELGSPVTALLLAARLVVRKLSAEGHPALDMAERLEQQAERLSALVQHMLVAADLASEPRQLEVVEFEPLALVTEVSAEAQRRAGGKATVEVRGTAPAVRGDRALLGQALYELIDNAVAHGSANIEVELSADAAEDTVRVMDRGPGVPSDVVRRLFDRFNLARWAMPTGGLGLGLYIASMIARAHGGSVSYEARPGGGACFVLRVPRQGPSGGWPAARQGEPPKRPRPGARSPPASAEQPPPVDGRPLKPGPGGHAN